MIAENKKKEQERATRLALAQANEVAASALESVDETPVSATYAKLEKSLPPDGKVPWGEFFR